MIIYTNNLNKDVLTNYAVVHDPEEGGEAALGGVGAGEGDAAVSLAVADLQTEDILSAVVSREGTQSPLIPTKERLSHDDDRI